MKKYVVSLCLVLVCGYILGQPSNTKKYSDLEAQNVLNALQKKYAAYTTIKMSFTLQSEKDNKIISEYKGTLLMKKQKYMLKMNNVQVFCNGENVWTYLPDSKEVNLNIYDSLDENQLNPLHMLNTYSQNYNSQMIREEMQRGILVQIIDLTPKKSSSVATIRLIINKDKKQILRAIIREKDGLLHTYFMENIAVNQNIADENFVFNPKLYPDVEVIDLR